MPSAMTNGTLVSPESDSFSTPPTSPAMEMRPSLSRRSSRPSSLTLQRPDAAWNPDILVEDHSPVITRKNGATGSPAAAMSQDITITPTSTGPQKHQKSHSSHPQPMNSPCFVHSQLDKGASLTEWLRNKYSAGLNDVGVAQSLMDGDRVNSSSSQSFSSVDDDEEYSGNLTRQLAETAVAVRDVNKQLGRARVHSNIQNVLIVTKAKDNRLIKLTRELALYLMLKKRPGQSRGLVVYVDNQLRTSRRFDADGIEQDYPELFIPFPRRRSSSSNSLSSMTSSSANVEDFKEQGQLRYWTSHMCNATPHLFDFVITLGGDGTVLFTSWLFQRIVPPVLPFALGSLGFLTNFDFADHQAVVDSAVDAGIRVNMRMRFTCTVYRAIANAHGKGRKAIKKGETGEIMMRNVEKGGWEALEGGWSGAAFPSSDAKVGKDREIMCFTTRPVETFEVLNDLVVDRGPSPYVSLLELFGDEHHMTTVQADGLTISTPTGSTAYSLSAGGSLVHPEIPSILITPICPHTLSFRPMLLPDSMELRICVPFNSRSTAWASFDGRGRVELKQGDHIKVTASKYPFPTVCADNQSTDWFHAISRTLKWNERERQKSFVVVEEGPAKKKSTHREATKKPIANRAVVEDDEDDGEIDDEEDTSDEEEEKFDIDIEDPSGGANNAVNISAQNSLGPEEKSIGVEKAKEVAESDRHYRMAAKALRLERQKSSKSRSPSPSLPSGIESPSRYAPITRDSSRSFSSLGVHYADQVNPEDGARDDIHTTNGRLLSSKSRIPKDRDIDLENVKTPTVANAMYRARGRSRGRSVEPHGTRAFAVWGQDESDSNASDSDA